MKLYDYTQDFEQLFVSGDIHGDIPSLVYKLKCMMIRNAVVIVAGDCGIGFEKKGFYDQLYRRIGNRLERNNCMLLLVRGNHDNPDYYENEIIDFPLMKTLPDYSVVRVKDRNILCVGGAISLDRLYRLQEMQNRRANRKSAVNIYWENEAPVYDEVELIKLLVADIHIDTVVTHTAPSFCYPAKKRNYDSRVLNDENLAVDVRKERLVMDSIYNKLVSDHHPLRNWFYAHFHSSNQEDIDGVSFSLLNIDELEKVE